jgi:hypothetical protein
MGRMPWLRPRPRAEEPGLPLGATGGAEHVRRCRSARDDPLGGVAQPLVRPSIPAVTAMHFEISDPAAVVFSHSFYQAIADGLPVDVAMVEARRAMFAAEGHEVESATPVLYLRSPEDRVFTKGRAIGVVGEPARRPTGKRRRRPSCGSEKSMQPQLGWRGTRPGPIRGYENLGH